MPLLGAKWVSLLPSGLDSYVESKVYRKMRAQQLMKYVLW
ncbi:rCG37116, partial [Rattus norvegicus]